MRRSARIRLVVAACLLVGSVVVAAGGSSPAQADATTVTAAAPTGPIGHSGRWLTDADGRVLLLNGVNFVDKGHYEGNTVVYPTPEGLGFGDDDAAWLAANGIDMVRLGFSPAAIMPTAGHLDTTYIDSFVHTVEVLQAHGLFVLVDLHQDGWGPAVDGNGFPAWMTLTHGAVNTHTGFPLYYVTNPAIQASFDSFWKNEAGPGGVKLQARVGAMFSALAAKLAANPAVLGYDLINEPWPGTKYDDCLNPGPGCPALDQSRLDPYYARMKAAIRAQDSTHLLFGEPWVLFNFGKTPTHMALPGGDPNSGMSFHMYTLAAADEPAVVTEAQAWSKRTGGALLASEFGAVTDTAANDRQIKLFDHGLVPWMFWTYEQLVDDRTGVADDHVVDSTAKAVVRPHPRAVAGTPSYLDYDLPTRTMRFGYSTDKVGGGSFGDGAVTSFEVAPRTYPGGYQVKVVGGTVTSAEGATDLTVVADPGVAKVQVLIWPAGEPEPPLEPPTTTTTTTTTSTTSSTTTTAPVLDCNCATAPPAEPVDTSADFTG